jgi:hypothetical protein
MMAMTTSSSIRVKAPVSGLAKFFRFDIFITDHTVRASGYMIKQLMRPQHSKIL